MQLGQHVTFDCKQSTHTGRKEVLTDSNEIAGSGLRHGTQPPPCVCSEGHPLDRLQRLLLRLQQYDCGICYKPGKEMPLADTLSRTYSGDYERFMSDQPQKQRWSASMPLTSFRFQTTTLRNFRERRLNPTLQFVKKAILDGFPDTKDEQPAAIHQYFEIWDELSVHDCVIFNGQRCITL